MAEFGLLGVRVKQIPNWKDHIKKKNNCVAKKKKYIHTYEIIIMFCNFHVSYLPPYTHAKTYF